MRNTLLTITLECPAKINLYLAVTGRRPDGYHELLTLMQTISLADSLRLSLVDSHRNIVLNCRSEEVHPSLDAPAGEDNIAWKAAKLLLEMLEVEGLRTSGGASCKDIGVEIELVKRIPAGRGLGSGSADAAGVLKAMGKLLGVERKTLMIAAETLGSDVTFCLSGGTRWCSGRGEKLGEHIPLQAFPALVLVSPPFGLSTAGVYAEFSLSDVSTPPVNPTLESARRLFGDLAAPILHNDLQPAAFRFQPEMRDYYQLLSNTAPGRVLMTGSGSCFSVFCTSPEEADETGEKIGRLLPEAVLYRVCPVEPDASRHNPTR